MRAWIGSVSLAVFAAIAVLFPLDAAASTASSPTTVSWYMTPTLQFTLTPNYTSGYGSVPASFGTQATPVAGAGACLQGCSVDFGVVQQGKTYLYKYAAKLSVNTNDTNGYNVYGEGTADFSDGSGNTMSLAQSLFFLPSVASGDTNTGFSPSYPFSVTSGTVNPTTPPTITYAVYPAPIASVATAGTSNVYEDYQIKVPYSATVSSYSAWIVYTVVAK